MKYKIMWEIEDGYIGKNRPQFFIFNTDDYMSSDEDWEALTEMEKQQFFEMATEEEFNMKIGWSIRSVEKIDGE